MTRGGWRAGLGLQIGFFQDRVWHLGNGRTYDPSREQLRPRDLLLVITVVPTATRRSLVGAELKLEAGLEVDCRSLRGGPQAQVLGHVHVPTYRWYT